MKNKETELKHLAIIMDGNARWAKKYGKATIYGHRQGAENIKELLPLFIQHNIEYVTLYSFSSENWQRPKKEVSLLLRLMQQFIKEEARKLHEQNIRIKVIGDLSKLSQKLQEEIKQLALLTKDNSALTLCFAFGYGGQDEIWTACNHAIKEGKTLARSSDLKQYLYDPAMPPVDLMVRTGGVFRISNFLLWHLAYAELYFSKIFLPEFKEQELNEAINWYYSQHRTFGRRSIG